MSNQSNIPIEDNTYPIQRAAVISNHSELLLRIADLKAVKVRQEEELKTTFSGLASTLNLVTFFNKMIEKDDHPQSLVQSGVNKAVGLVFDIAFSRNRSIPGILSSVFVSKFANTLIIKKLPLIISGISSLLHRNHRSKTNIKLNQQSSKK
ncbi:MAG: hypothetical protein ACYC2P_07320 [Paludibacteraceae bacterium]